MQVISNNFTKQQINDMDEFAENVYFCSVSELVREAVRICLGKLVREEITIPHVENRNLNVPLKSITTFLPDELLTAIEILQRKKVIETRSSLMRFAVDDFINELRKFQEQLKNLSCSKSPQKRVSKFATQKAINTVNIGGSELKIQSISEYLKSRRMITT